MSWTEVLNREIEETYETAAGLVDLVDEDQLGWKPATGENWMTTGQLLEHLAAACGAPVRNFVTGEWKMPEGFDPSSMEMPPVETMPSCRSLASVREALEADRKMALGSVVEAGEERLANEATTAPWDPTPTPLGHRILTMVGHLNLHKAQLFYYLKLQGKPVDTWNLYRRP